MKLSSSVSIFFYSPLLFYLLAHLHRSHRLTDFRDLWLKRRVLRHLRPFWGANKKIILSTIFRKNRENYNGKDRQNIQIGINFISVQDIDTLCACIVGFSGSAKSNVLSEFSSEQRELPWQPNLGKN